MPRYNTKNDTQMNTKARAKSSDGRVKSIKTEAIPKMIGIAIGGTARVAQEAALDGGLGQRDARCTTGHTNGINAKPIVTAIIPNSAPMIIECRSLMKPVAINVIRPPIKKPVSTIDAGTINGRTAISAETRRKSRQVSVFLYANIVNAVIIEPNEARKSSRPMVPTITAGVLPGANGDSRKQ